MTVGLFNFPSAEATPPGPRETVHPLFKICPQAAPSGGPYKPTSEFICGDGWGGRSPALKVGTLLSP